MTSPFFVLDRGRLMLGENVQPGGAFSRASRFAFSLPCFAAWSAYRDSSRGDDALGFTLRIAKEDMLSYGAAFAFLPQLPFRLVPAGLGRLSSISPDSAPFLPFLVSRGFPPPAPRVYAPAIPRRLPAGCRGEREREISDF